MLFSEVIMPARSTLKVFALCALVLSLIASVVAVQAQRRKRPSRRATAPVSPTYVPAPSPTAPDDPRLVSTADDQSQTDTSRTGSNTRRTTSTSPDADASSRAVKQLSNEVTQ